jgi:eukaryotic-like serine/threonine-protein kinase
MGLSFEPGEVLCAKYRVEGLLGTGGMGIVIAAEHIHLGERVALKILRPDLMHDPRLVGRFEREARAAAKIRSEHVARVSDVGRLDSGLPFMVMEYLHGWDLGAYLKQHGALALPEAADYLLQACEAIAEAHALGIVHRDLKPENLFLTTLPDGSYSIKVLDFGISKIAGLAGSSGHQATLPQGMMGSPLYMSPEQLRSARDVDVRADIWALGVILFELLTRETPFVADTLPQLCTAILEAPPIPLARYRPALPAALAELVAGCLRKERESRIASVAEFARQLAQFAPDHARLSAERIARIALGGRTRIPSLGTMHASAAPIAQPSSDPAPPSPPERPRRPFTIAIAAGGIAASLALMAWLQPCASAAPRAAGPPPPVSSAPAPALPAPVLPAPVPETVVAPAPNPKVSEASGGSAAFKVTASERARSASSSPERKRALKPRPEANPARERPLGGRL